MFTKLKVSHPSPHGEAQCDKPYEPRIVYKFRYERVYDRFDFSKQEEKEMLGEAPDLRLLDHYLASIYDLFSQFIQQPFRIRLNKGDFKLCIGYKSLLLTMSHK